MSELKTIGDVLASALADQERKVVVRDLPTVGARVRLEIEILSTATWTATTTMAQIVDQAKSHVNGVMHKLKFDVNSPLNGNVRVIGEPVVIAVMAAEKGKAL
jgi:hypothetical protein